MRDVMFVALFALFLVKNNFERAAISCLVVGKVRGPNLHYYLLDGSARPGTRTTLLLWAVGNRDTALGGS